MSLTENGLRKQVTEAKEGPLELGREKGKSNMTGAKKRRKVQAYSQRESALGWVLRLKGF